MQRINNHMKHKFLYHIPFKNKLLINKSAEGIVNLPTTILASVWNISEAGGHFVPLFGSSEKWQPVHGVN